MISLCLRLFGEAYLLVENNEMYTFVVDISAKSFCNLLKTKPNVKSELRI